MITTTDIRPPVRQWALRTATLLLAGVAASSASAQNFVAVADSTNPIATINPGAAYSGAAWVDMDGDGLLDLYIARKRPIFRNLGDGDFERIAAVFPPLGAVIGTSWSDYDNDGDIDCFVVGGPSGQQVAVLYRNDGSLAFTGITAGAVGDLTLNTG